MFESCRAHFDVSEGGGSWGNHGFPHGKLMGIERCPAEAEVACSNHAGRISTCLKEGAIGVAALERARLRGVGREL